MKRLIALLALLLPSLGVLPGPIWVGDFDADGDTDGADIKLAIDSCRDGFVTGDGGCTVMLEAKTYSLTSTLLWGDGTVGPEDSLNGVTLQGMAPCTLGISPPYIGGGTVLKWDGADLGTMVEIERSMKGSIRKLCLIMDPDLAVATGNEARYGIYWDGDNGTLRKTTQGFVLEDVSVWTTITGTPPAGSVGIYITGAGTTKSAQNDKMVFERVWTEGADIGLKQDALQAVLNTCRACSLFGQSKAVELSGGDWKFTDTVAGVRATTGGIVYDLPYATGFTGGRLTLEDSYFEGPMAGVTWIKVGQGYSSGNTTYGSYDVIIRGGYVHQQCSTDPCTFKLIDGAIRHVSVDGLYVNSDSAGKKWSVDVSNFNGSTAQLATFNWQVGLQPWNHSTEMVVQRTTGVRWFAPASSGTGVVWNDLDLDYVQDAGEPSF